MTITAPDLTALLTLDFKPSDTGDNQFDFDLRIAGVVASALSRAVIVPPAVVTLVTDAQIIAGARYSLLNAQLRQLVRQPNMKRLGDAAKSWDAPSRLAEVRIEMYAALLASGLGTPARVRTLSDTATVQGTF